MQVTPTAPRICHRFFSLFKDALGGKTDEMNNLYGQIVHDSTSRIEDGGERAPAKQFITILTPDKITWALKQISKQNKAKSKKVIQVCDETFVFFKLQSTYFFEQWNDNLSTFTISRNRN